MVADAAVLSVLCRYEAWSVNRDAYQRLWIAGNFQLSESALFTQAIDREYGRKAGEPNDRICRDAREKYGPTGTVYIDFLVSASDQRALKTSP